MKKIFINTPYSRDANSFWRCMGPMSYLAKNSGGDIQIHLPQDGSSIAWDRISEFDCIFMHRPCRPDDMKLLQLAKLLNIPVWSDYDDWLFHLPDWNSAAKTYHHPEIQNIMASVIACSDVVTVSTTALYTQFKKITEQVILLPNAYRSDLFPFRTPEMPDRKEEFVWRGTNTHDGDLLGVQYAFHDLPKKVNFLGSAPYALTSQMDQEQYETHEMVDPFLYWRKIHGMAPKAWLFPLQNCFFNECKSNISWIEAVHAGALCIAPDMPEWRHPGVVTYTPNDSDSFLNAAKTVMKMDTSDFNTHVSAAFTYMKNKFDISLVNELRSSILHSLFHPSFQRNRRDAFNNLTGMWALGVLKSVPELEKAV